MIGSVCCAVERQDDLKLLELAPGGGDTLARGKVLVPKALDADDEEDAESDDESEDDDEARSPCLADFSAAVHRVQVFQAEALQLLPC